MFHIVQSPECLDCQLNTYFQSVIWKRTTFAQTFIVCGNFFISSFGSLDMTFAFLFATPNSKLLLAIKRYHSFSVNQILTHWYTNHASVTALFIPSSKGMHHFRLVLGVSLLPLIFVSVLYQNVFELERFIQRARTGVKLFQSELYKKNKGKP